MVDNFPKTILQSTKNNFYDPCTNRIVHTLQIINEILIMASNKSIDVLSNNSKKEN